MNIVRGDVKVVFNMVINFCNGGWVDESWNGTVIIQTAAEYGGIAYPYIKIEDCNKFREIFSN